MSLFGAAAGVLGQQGAGGGGGGTPVVEGSDDVVFGAASITVPSMTNGLLLVCIADVGSNTVSGVTFGSDSMTLLAAASSGTTATNRKSYIWYLLDPPASTAALTRTGMSAAGSTVAVYISGVNQGDPLGTPATASATTGTSSSVSPSGSAGNLWLDSLAIRTTSTPVDGADQTTISVYAAVSNCTLAVSTKESTGLSWTWTGSDNNAHVGVAIKGA